MVESVSIKALRPPTVAIICNLLNPRKIFATDEGLERNWRGLAQLVGIDGRHLPSLIQEENKTDQILKLWQTRDKANATIPTLLEYLERLDRFDIVDDIKDLIVTDIEFYKNQPKAVVTPLELQNDKLILTIDDVTNIEKGLPLQNYDAFVLFDDDDIIIATELIEKLEKEYKLKLCVTERDLVGGSLEFDAATRLITERCHRLIVIISPAFLESQANKFFLKFAQALAIEQRQRKVIPCLFKPTNLPVDLSCFHILDYQRISKFYDFWQKLRDSIRVLPSETTLRTNEEFVQYRAPAAIKKADSVQVKIEPPASIIASTSSDSINTKEEREKEKQKKSWKRILLPMNSKSEKESSSSNNTSTKSKYKKFFRKYSKKAVAS